MTILKTEITGIVKDTNSGALLNTDNAALEAYKKRKKAAEDLNVVREKIKEIDPIKEDLAEIKTLLNKLLEKM